MTERTGDATPSGADPSRPQPESNADPRPAAADPASVAPADDPAAPPTPRRRWRIGRQLTVWTILVPLVAVLAGALFSASSGAAQGTDLRSAASGLADVIREETRQATLRAAEVTRLQDEVASLTELRTDRDEAVASILDSASRYAQEAGTVPVTGPGVAVSLTDSPLRGDQVPEGLTVDDLVVHQQDVQGVVNALWRGGAEAMMIQDQRVISTSAVRCVGNTLILQGRVYSPPFVITAIGDQDRLQEALENDRAVQIYQEYVQAAGLGYAVEVLDQIEAPAYSGSVGLQHATPIR